MSLLTPPNSLAQQLQAKPATNNSTEVVDLLKGLVMLLLALGYIFDYFREGTSTYQAFDPGRANFDLFVKWIAQYAAPVFIFLTGISAFLNGQGKSRIEISTHLLKRGLLLVCAEFVVGAIGNGFNPGYPLFHLQVIFTTGIGMIALSGMVYMGKSTVLWTGLLLFAVPLVSQSLFTGDYFRLISNINPYEIVMGRCSLALHMPVMTAIGMIAIGYYVGNFFRPGYHAEIRKTALLFLGVGAIGLFFALRVSDPSAEANHWSKEENALAGILLFFDITNYPSYMLNSLVTIGPGLVFLSIFENPLNRITRHIAWFGKMPVYYFIIHIYLIHLFSESGKLMASFVLPDLVSASHGRSVAPHGLEFSNVYFLWIGLVILLFTFRRWIDRCKKNLHCTQL